MKRKRAASEPGWEESGVRQAKQAKTNAHLQAADAVTHPVLGQYYSKLQTLRQYVLFRLPVSSRIRRRKITSVGQSGGVAAEAGASARESSLCRLLDTTIVGFDEDTDSTTSWDALWEQWISASQKGDESYVTLRGGAGKGAVGSQAEIVDAVIWLLFEREKKAQKRLLFKGDVRPQNLLCDGYRCAAVRHSDPRSSIPGLFSAHLNSRAQMLKQSPWPELLALLGSAGERIMRNLLLNCAVFLPVDAGAGNFWQLSGKSLADQGPQAAIRTGSKASAAGMACLENKPNDIAFVRSRMLYARAALNARGSVRFGLRHVHVLNRFPHKPQHCNVEDTGRPVSSSDDQERGLIRVMMYMFPRQFGLHNVFTSKVDRTKTAQKFQDYTMREDEIAEKYSVLGNPQNLKPHIPKRLRGQAKWLVQGLRISHSRCSYTELIQHYCPIKLPSSDADTELLRQTHDSLAVLPNNPTLLEGAASQQSRPKQSSNACHNARPSIRPLAATGFASLAELATPVANVSAFSRAALNKVIPHAFWGTGNAGTENLKIFLRMVGRFVRLRRFESMTLHDVMQGMKITDIEWLSPPSTANGRSCLSDTRKKTELFWEFIYFLFDSLLIPLLRSNFYVTESGVHRNRLFFFRHDVWRTVAEPAMASLKARMFEEVRLEDALAVLGARDLGFSQVRLLPKQSGMRPIMNLRRRSYKKGGRMVLGPSINTVLAPVQTALNLEKMLHPEVLGSAMFSVGDLYTRIRDFKRRLDDNGRSALYFAKVDVQAAFDTIPQATIVSLMKRIPTQDCYRVIKYLELRSSKDAADSGGLSATKAPRRWFSLAKAAGDQSTAAEVVAQRCAAHRKESVFIDSVVQRTHDTQALLRLLASHVEQNLVKIGKKFFRQKEGIPQGSVLSSLLSSYFYADLERQRLPFLQSADCLLLRLIDDFLLITTDKAKACRFVRVMHEGVPEYGVSVNPAKTLVNFALEHDGQQIQKMREGHGFPYCGTRLDCRTLEIVKDRETAGNLVVFDALTVEYSRRPGQVFKRKVLNAFRIQSHHMFFDSVHNSQHTVVTNLYQAFVETATKTWAYMRCMPKLKQPSPNMVIDAIKQLVDCAYALLTGKFRKTRWPGYQCTISRTQVVWLACHAFRTVLMKKQSRHREVLTWLDRETDRLAGLRETSQGFIRQVVST